MNRGLFMKKTVAHAFVCLFIFLLYPGTSPLPAQAADKLPQPVLISSAGQSADVAIAGMLCKKLSLQAKSQPLAKPADLQGIGTLMVVSGFSTKGLGAAGVSKEQEMERVKALLDAAREKKIRVITLHIGGKARRGGQSDDFNRLAAEASERLIVVRTGDEDQFFSSLAAGKKIPIDLVDKISDAMQPLGKIF